MNFCIFRPTLIRAEAVASGYVTAEAFDKYVRPEEMIFPK